MALQMFEHLTVGPLGCNCYIVGDPVTRAAIVIDPGGDASKIIDAAELHGLTIAAQVATHAHFDHVLAADEIRSLTGAPFYIHQEDVALLDWIGPSMEMFLGVQGLAAPDVDHRVADGDRIPLADGGLVVLHTPGHSPGSISLLDPETALYSGDTLFADSIGRTDLPGGDFAKLDLSVKSKIFTLEDLPVFPGHGPSTTVHRERVSNPFVGTGAR